MRARELRIALGMRGGASLAIWIGGACAEIDAVRRSVVTDDSSREPVPEGGSDFWRRLGAASDYDAVVVDVMAGASAGGLNGVLYAAGQVHGFSMDRLRGVWATLGDTQSLLRPRGTATWPSLFRADDFFFTELEDQLRRLAGTGSPPAQVPAVDLRLSATHVEPVRRPARSPEDEELTERRFSAGFRFRVPAYAWLGDDLRPDGTTASGAQAWSSRLSLAARATSSFPGAFEAAKVRAARPDSFGARTDLEGGIGVDMGGIFHDRAGEGAPSFVVSDGGVLDNIPLGRALDAVAEAPADGPTDRVLLYLQPGVPSVPKRQPVRSDAHRETAVSVLLGALHGRMPAEDIVGDLAQLEDYNGRVEQAASLRRSRFARLTGPDDLLATAADAWDGYRVLRVEEDRRLVAGLLEDPVGTLGEDPFPARAGGLDVADDRWRSPLHAAPGSADRLDRERLDRELARSFDGRFADTWEQGQQDVWRIGVRPVLRVTQLLVEWAQYLEAAGVAEAGAGKAELYRIATFLRLAVDRPRRLGWVTVAATRPTRPGPGVEAELVDRSAAALALLVRLPAREVDDVVAALRHDRTDDLRRLLEARVAAVDGVVAAAWSGRDPADPAEPARPEDLVDLRRAVVTELLLPVVRSLQQARDADVIEGAPTHSGAFLDRVLTGPTGAEHLAALEVVTFLEFATGLPARRPVRMRRVSSAAETPVAPYLVSLLGAAAERGAWWDPATPGPTGQRGVHVDLKLTGNQYGSFSAFLDRRWRLNDWMWGRLDAVPTLVDLLVTPASVARMVEHGDPLAQVEDLVLGDASDPARRAFLSRHVWTPERRTAVAAELATLAGRPGPAADMAATTTVTTAVTTTVLLVETRRALVAARQWEVLATEAAVTGREGPEADPWREDVLLARVAAYDTGAESLGSPRVRRDVRSRLRAIAWVAGDVAAYNATEHAPRRRRLPFLARWTVRVVAWPVVGAMTRAPR